MDFYSLSVLAPNGKIISMEQFRGKVVLVVNTATKCGFSDQLNGLEELHKSLKNEEFVILGFPCNQFRNQEPETNETIVSACEINFGVTFQLTELVQVNGPDTHPVFKYLKEELSGFLGPNIKWNFTKFLIDKTGKPIKRYSSLTKPQQLKKKIINLL